MLDTNILTMALLRRWREWIRPLSILVYILILIIALPLCIWELHRAEASTHVTGWFVGGLFVFMTLPISLWGIVQHLIHYKQPFLQRHIIRILWMVPIYSLNGWFGLRFPHAAIYLDTMRECYEAYVIYNFMSFLLNFLNAEFNLEATLEAKSQVPHIFPARLVLRDWEMGRKFVRNCKHGALQYTVIRPLTTAVAFFTEVSGVYEEGTFAWSNAWTYLVVINNISQIYAMYCLVLFYQACKEELKPMKPLGKFMCVKAVVFASFWQSVLIAILVQVGVIKDNPSWTQFDSKSVAASLQDFCICIEMFFAAIGHYYSFSHKPYIESGGSDVSCLQSFFNMFDVSDMQNDFAEHVRFVGTQVRSVPNILKGGGSSSFGSEAAALSGGGRMQRGERSRLLDDEAELGDTMDDAFQMPTYSAGRSDQPVTFTPLQELHPLEPPANLQRVLDQQRESGDEDGLPPDIQYPVPGRPRGDVSVYGTQPFDQGDVR